MEGSMAEKVKIFGTEYRVRGDADSEYIQQLAAYVDDAMLSIAGSSRHISPTRIAVLAAFNIADELFRKQHGSKSAEAKVEDKAAELLQLFDLEELDRE
jgi:cell division protein ZapA